MGKNILIYGSCVSRDAYNTFSDEYSLTGYVPRQSMISAMARPTTLPDGINLESNFQNRSMSGDLQSNLLPTLRRNAARTDLLLVDLTDERLGVARLADKSFVTRSKELMRTKRLDLLPDKPVRFDFGTDRHTQVWMRAATNLFARIQAMPFQVLVINTPWAHMTDEGRLVPDERVSPSVANTTFQTFADHLRELEVNVVDMPGELALSTASHKWGPAAYHYAPPAYQWIRNQVEAVL
ncbi:DUF6270 domain-containing protein [Arthrobacter sp. 260]|uniref:DUF6270 domain-containing protein n=1 Tax=Arthrobacter sp. 260 TaxID=2735314 RepID=UPI001492A556|nr:DUF6270 domain-containing protein [Arthrobacter sp. 260]NOJ61712.1 hypothetical protein [Arthrobacter sp. 260]